MAELIETIIDDWLADVLEAEMGASSSQTTLQLQTIEANILTNARDWQHWTDFPGVGFGGRVVMRVSPGHMGNSLYHRRLPYVVTFVQYSDERNQAIYDARVLIKRAEGVFRRVKARAIDWISEQADDGEEAMLKHFHPIGSEDNAQHGSSRIRVIPDPRPTGRWYVAADYNVEFGTKTGD